MFLAPTNVPEVVITGYNYIDPKKSAGYDSISPFVKLSHVYIDLKLLFFIYLTKGAYLK